MRKNDATNVGVFGVRERMSRRRAIRMGMGAAALALGAIASRLARAQGHGADEWATQGLGGEANTEPDGLLAEPRALVVADHRKIMEIAITRRPDINPTHSANLTAEVVLARVIASARSVPEYELAQSSLKGVETHNSNMRVASIPSHPITVAGNKVIRKIVAHTGTAQALADLLRSEAALIADQALKAGVTTAANIIADGVGTIYNRDWWIPMIHDPRQIWGQLERIGSDLNKLGGFLGGVAKEDAKGAVEGAIAGAIAGSTGGPKGAAAGAALGAIGSAIGHSVVAVIF